MAIETSDVTMYQVAAGANTPALYSMYYAGNNLDFLTNSVDVVILMDFYSLKVGDFFNIRYEADSNPLSIQTIFAQLRSSTTGGVTTFSITRFSSIDFPVMGTFDASKINELSFLSQSRTAAGITMPLVKTINSPTLSLNTYSHVDGYEFLSLESHSQLYDIFIINAEVAVSESDVRITSAICTYRIISPNNVIFRVYALTTPSGSGFTFNGDITHIRQISSGNAHPRIYGARVNSTAAMVGPNVSGSDLASFKKRTGIEFHAGDVVFVIFVDSNDEPIGTGTVLTLQKQASVSSDIPTTLTELVPET